MNRVRLNCATSGFIGRPRTPCGGRWIGQAMITWSAVCSVAPHSHPGEAASPYLCMSERKRPTPVRKRLSLTQAVLARDIPGRFGSASAMKSQSLKVLFCHSVLNMWFIQCAALSPRTSALLSSCCAAGTKGCLDFSRCFPGGGRRSKARWAREIVAA
ncbi:unnamed protein product [Clavelina lepadiformis]|uniref:Uncharacterized protein n=1 Tax=Clavelina lepadiformis TaxID=159417 RepID=A0ABP0G7J7_CLALP